MLNFRKLRQDFSSAILKEGKELFDKKFVLDAKILHVDGETIRLGCRVRGAFDNVYESEVEIDRNESSAVDSNCDCTYTYDCQHIAALLYYLEHNINEIVVAYSAETDLDKCERIDEVVKQELKERFEEAAAKEGERKDVECQKEILREYIAAAKELANSAFFLNPEELSEDQAELAIIISNRLSTSFQAQAHPEIQIALRLPNRSKPLAIPHFKAFVDALRYGEPLMISGRRYFFSLNSFDILTKEILTLVMNSVRFPGQLEEKMMRHAILDAEALGDILAKAYDLAVVNNSLGIERHQIPFPCLFVGSLEEPLFFSKSPPHIRFTLDYVEAPAPSLLLKPSIQVEEETISLEEACLFESTKPGLVYKNTYYRFPPHIKRAHLRHLNQIQGVSIPEPLFGSFIENALPVLRKYAEVTNPSLVERFATLPYVEAIKGRCVIHYLDGELEAQFFFLYNENEVPAIFHVMEYSHVALFVTEEGVLARNLVEEREILEEIFQDFLFDEKEGVFRAKSEKKIVEFMTEVIPRHQHHVNFECPENLADQFIYDNTAFTLQCSDSDRVDVYEVELIVDGYLKGVSIDLLWDCVAANKRFLELEQPRSTNGKKGKQKIPRILVIELEKIAPLIQIFDEIGLVKIDNHKDYRPLWSLTTLNADQFKGLPVKFSMNNGLKEIQKQILGEKPWVSQEIPKNVQATLRKYQIEGVNWLERLRQMYLNGILADDMGLGKTLQAIIAVTQAHAEKKGSLSLIVCPTSLLYNWKEEFHKFNPGLKVLVVDGIPAHRKKLLQSIQEYDVAVTSYNLLQKDIETYNTIHFKYAILDEAQHIKNRGTRNAKSVKRIRATHRLILTGTPLENSLEELWSLFDFLMPGLLSSFDRFVEKYIRSSGHHTKGTANLESLRKKVSPFIMRRMKEDVLEDLPPISEIIYHCHLSDVQKELYRSYAASAKEELSKLVKKEGFDKIQIHVLATLTRLKQICCHPAIFAKERHEEGDSAKYDMLMELLNGLIEGKHKTVIFSQYTKMLSIMREDFESRGIPFAYLDGSSKNRLEIVKKFNEDRSIPVFLVSLKAGGAGLNLVGADTVIHYDIWWNPAVESQATDRVHRLGQKESVSSYKLVTLNTIEEKILNLQKRKKGLVKKVINSDDEAISKLTWEEVLELLQI